MPSPSFLKNTLRYVKVLDTANRMNNKLVIIILCYLAAFALEGMSLLFSTRHKDENEIA